MGIEDVVRELNNTSPIWPIVPAAITAITLAAGYVLGRLHGSKLHSKPEGKPEAEAADDSGLLAKFRKYDWQEPYEERTIRKAKESEEPSTLTVKVESFYKLEGGYTGHISDITDTAEFFIRYKVGQSDHDLVQERGIPILLDHKKSGTESILVKAYYDSRYNCFIIGQMTGTVKGSKHEITLIF